jgi:5-guanidino-2-oxopentanoate decarboxylase
MVELPTSGEALIQLLCDYGVDTVFGIPGAHTMDLYRGIAKTPMRHVLARHEQGAGFMADGYARATGQPGVCVLITGPGVTNATTPLGQAFADSRPMLLISSDNPTPTLGKGWGNLHEITDQQAVTAPLTALSVTAMSPADIPELIGRAFAIFESARPRPAHIAVPLDVMAMPPQGDWSPRKPPARPMPTPDELQSAAELLARSEQPVILVGGGAIEAHDKVTELAELLGAGVIASNAAKGVVPDSHPLSLSASLVRKATQDYLGEADVVLALGTELAETESFLERLPINGKLIRIDIDPDKINDRYPADIGLHGDASLTVAALLTALKETVGAGKDPTATIDAVRSRVNKEVSDIERQHQKLCGAIRRALPDDTMIFGDLTQLVYTASFALPVDRPRAWTCSAGYGPLGCALPMAIGAKLAMPNRPVAVIAGDGGFMFTVQELATAVELEQSMPIVIWNNDGLGQIRDDMKRLGIPAIGVDSLNPDFMRLAEAFGCQGLRPDSPEAFEAAVTRAFTTPVPTLIEVHQDADWLC